MSNATAVKFGFPDGLIAENRSWWLLLRPRQPTLGSLVLVCREPVTAFAEASPDAFADLQPMVAGIESLLKVFVDYRRINYLMLMMVDPDVHFHVIPRYEGERTFAQQRFADAGWPGPPALEANVALDEGQRRQLVARLRALWNEPR